jgi:hypothetical protein
MKGISVEELESRIYRMYAIDEDFLRKIKTMSPIQAHEELLSELEKRKQKRKQKLKHRKFV